jgi:hypothetical protein
LELFTIVKRVRHHLSDQLVVALSIAAVFAKTHVSHAAAMGAFVDNISALTTILASAFGGVQAVAIWAAVNFIEHIRPPVCLGRIGAHSKHRLLWLCVFCGSLGFPR